MNGDDYIKELEAASEAEIAAVNNGTSTNEDDKANAGDAGNGDPIPDTGSVNDDAATGADGKLADGQADEEADDEELSDEKKRARAFARQRHATKELKEQLEAERTARQEMAERLARMEGRTEALKAPEKAAESTEDQEPDRDLYPEDWNAWRINQLEKKLDTFGNRFAETEKVTQFQRELNAVAEIERGFKDSTPDYDGAVDFLVAKERRIKKLMNPQASDAQIEAQIKAEKVGLFKQLAATGRNPAELVYNLAKEDGWIPSAKKAMNGGEQRQRVDLTRVAENQRKSASLIGGAPAGDASGKLTSDQLLKMSQKDLLNLSGDDWEKALSVGALS